MEQPSFMFLSDKLELKTEGENFYVEGYISTSDLDQVNDIVTKACLLDMAEQMRNRVIKFDVEHESFKGKSNLDREINKTKIPVAKTEDFIMDKKGIKVRAVLNKHSTRFDEVKGSIDDGFLDAFSIAYIPVKSVVEKRDGQEVRLLDKINLLNVAFTGNPVNTEAKMTNVFMKSLEFLQEKERHGNEEEDEDEDEDGKKKKKKKKKPGYKEYGEDGKHVHTDSDPMGEHDHPYISDRIKFLHERIDNILDPKQDSDVMIMKDKELEKNYIHKRDELNLKEEKQMSEEGKEDNVENEEESNEEESKESEESEESEAKEEEGSESKEEESKDEDEDTEVKALKEEMSSMKKEIVEIKALLKKPVHKSKVGIQDKSKDFAEEKSKDPLDLIS